MSDEEHNEIETAEYKAPAVFTFTSPTNEEVEEGEEIVLPSGLIAHIVDTTSTPRLAEANKRAALKVGGKNALTDIKKLAGAASVQAQARVYADYHVKYLRTPNGEPLRFAGVEKNGEGPKVFFNFPDGRVETFKDKYELLLNFPELRKQVREAIGDADEETEPTSELLGN